MLPWDESEPLAHGKKRSSLLSINIGGGAMMDVTYWFKPVLREAGLEDYH